jgi:hypothetical protein
MSVPVAVDPEFTLESPLAPRASPGGRTQPAGAADGTLTNGDDHATQYSDYGMTANVRQGLIAHEVGDSSSSDGLMVNGSAEDFPSVSKTSRRNRLLLIGGVTTVVTTIIAVCIYLAIMSRRRSGCQDSSVDSCALLCSGILLQTIQFSGLFNDSKTFVDMPMVNSPQCVLDDFNSLSDYSPSSLYTFVERNFEQSCTDMLPWSPPDYDDEPKFLDKIEDKILKEWTYDVHALWNLLGRQVSPDVYENPLRHTLLRLRSPHMIVPGGRFCEFYYWSVLLFSLILLLGLRYHLMCGSASSTTVASTRGAARTKPPRLLLVAHMSVTHVVTS